MPIQRVDGRWVYVLTTDWALDDLGDYREKYHEIGAELARLAEVQNDIETLSNIAEENRMPARYARYGKLIGPGHPFWAIPRAVKGADRVISILLALADEIERDMATAAEALEEEGFPGSEQP